MTLLYRESRGGPVLARSFDEGTVWAKTGLVKGAGKAAGSAARAVNMVEVAAYDDGWDEVYKEAETWEDQNGGRGFGPWTVYGDTAATRKLDWVDGSQAGHENDGDFTLHAEGGETIVRRSLAMAVTGDGRFSVRVWLGAMKGVFCGFSVYADKGELFRWGYGRAETGEWGLVYATEGSNLYDLLDEGLPAAEYIDFELTWGRVDDGLQFMLASKSSVATGYSNWFDEPVAVRNAGAVAGIAVMANSAAAGSPAEITFDQVKVSGYAAVPEPGTLGLLAAGAAMLAARRRKGQEGKKG